MTPFTHVYSDPHFGHARIIEYCERPFGSVEEMNGELFDQYWKGVDNDAHVLWLGDCVFGGLAPFRHFLDLMPGRKTLVRGNHDRREVCELFDVVVDELAFEFDGLKLRASHYPQALTFGAEIGRFGDRRPVLRHGEWLLHGHTHAPERINRERREVHCGVDAWDYAPVALDTIAALIRQEETE